VVCLRLRRGSHSCRLRFTAAASSQMLFCRRFRHQEQAELGNPNSIRSDVWNWNWRQRTIRAITAITSEAINYRLTEHEGPWPPLKVHYQLNAQRRSHAEWEQEQKGFGLKPHVFGAELRSVSRCRLGAAGLQLQRQSLVPLAVAGLWPADPPPRLSAARFGRRETPMHRGAPISILY
jgi:hypothetical protein